MTAGELQELLAACPAEAPVVFDHDMRGLMSVEHAALRETTPTQDRRSVASAIADGKRVRLTSDKVLVLS